MSRPSASQWLRQAASDLACAERSLLQDDTTTYCHALAKYQQAVEKSLKGLVVALRLMEPTKDHEAAEEIRQLCQYIRSPRGRRNATLVVSIHKLMRPENRADINDLCLLSPRYPQSGEKARRNTEYPFQDAEGAWRIPAEAGSFTMADIMRFRRIAEIVHRRANEVVFASGKREI